MHQRGYTLVDPNPEADTVDIEFALHDGVASRGIPAPTMVNGVLQSPFEGTSMLYSFNDADAPERHETRYFEMFCNRGIYHKGWSAVTKHRTPWEMSGAVMPAFDDDVWELYDGSSDWTQSNDLSKDNPDKLHGLQRLWLTEAVKYNVLPLDDRQIERFIPESAGRPTLIKGNTQLLFGNMGRLSEQIDLGEDAKDADHYIDPDERFRIAMARQ